MGKSSSSDSPQWGREFGSDSTAQILSNEGTEFTWYIAGWKEIGSERENLEDQPHKVLSDEDLHNADYVVVWMDGVGYRVFTDGPWDDWDDLYDGIAGFYTQYE